MKVFHILLLVIILQSCSQSGSVEAFHNSLHAPLGSPRFGEDNSFTQESVELGEMLFFDKRLSFDNSISCAHCHHPEKAFTDGKKVSIGVKGRSSMRNSPTLLNVGYLPHLTWDGGIPTLEMQMLVPLQDSNEMNSNLTSLIDKLSQDATIQYLSQIAYKRDFDIFVLTRSIGNFQRSLISQHSIYDKWENAKEVKGFSNQAAKGYELFKEKFKCAQCHQPPLFTSNAFEKNGYLGNPTDKGRYRISRDSADLYKFRIPTLRNIELTAPYMHDGGIKTLDETIAHYSKMFSNPDFRKRLRHDSLPYSIKPKEKEQLISFLKTFTDTSYMSRFR